jgi:hypothetical protein
MGGNANRSKIRARSKRSRAGTAIEDAPVLFQIAKASGKTAAYPGSAQLTAASPPTLVRIGALSSCFHQSSTRLSMPYRRATSAALAPDRDAYWRIHCWSPWLNRS